MLKPVLPYVSDLLAHVFWYSDHMATMHYENGKFHVHLQSSEAAKADYPGKVPNTFKSEVSVGDHLPVLIQENQNKLTFSRHYSHPKEFFFSCEKPGYDYPPPRIV